MVLLMTVIVGMIVMAVIVTAVIVARMPLRIVCRVAGQKEMLFCVSEFIDLPRNRAGNRFCR